MIDDQGTPDACKVPPPATQPLRRISLDFWGVADKFVVNQAHHFYWPPRTLRFGVHPTLSGNPTCEYLRHIWLLSSCT
jgi:hypothetical protein